MAEECALSRLSVSTVEPLPERFSYQRISKRPQQESGKEVRVETEQEECPSRARQNGFRPFRPTNVAEPTLAPTAEATEARTKGQFRTVAAAVVLVARTGGYRYWIAVGFGRRQGGARA
jgi:hypothetical protein